MESLSDAIKQRIAKVGIAKAVTATQILETANRILPETAHASVLKGDVLHVSVGTSADAYFLKQETEEHIERINTALGESRIKQLRIQIKPVA